MSFCVLFGSKSFLLIGGAVAVHVAVPWVISLLTPRYFWVGSSPGAWNLIGLIPVATGLAMIAWAGSLHLMGSSGAWELERTPRYILIKGPYRFSRNPMYLLELAMWLGWAIFYGTIAVLIAFVAWWIVFAFLAIPYEERLLAVLWRHLSPVQEQRSTLVRAGSAVVSAN